MDIIFQINFSKERLFLIHLKKINIEGEGSVTDNGAENEIKFKFLACQFSQMSLRKTRTSIFTLHLGAK